MIRAVSANLGRRDVAAQWVEDVLGRSGDDAVDLLFLQEVPVSRDWETICSESGFDVGSGAGPTYQVRSLVVWRRSAISGAALTLPTAGYHGSYLAAARLKLPMLGNVLAVSVHASPAVVESGYQEIWLGTGRDLPQPRTAASSGELWDSDFVLATLAELARLGPTLVAGDFNECLAWDQTHPGEWGKEYFERVARARLISLTHRDGGIEQQTAFTHDGLEYQLDHVLATPEVARHVLGAPRVDSTWTRDAVLAGATSDHAPIWFEIQGLAPRRDECDGSAPASRTLEQPPK
jgi:endonuclease/exonuclease/phosphatase family metal-dependent hydrolase